MLCSLLGTCNHKMTENTPDILQQMGLLWDTHMQLHPECKEGMGWFLTHQHERVDQITMNAGLIGSKHIARLAIWALKTKM